MNTPEIIHYTPVRITQKENLKLLRQLMNKEIWSKILNIVITVLTAIATTFGVTSCMGV